VAAVATTRLPTRAACTVPNARNISQSIATWFQPASRTSASASPSSDAASDAPMTGSEGAIAGIEVGVLAEARQTARHPVGGPVDHPVERNARLAKQPDRLLDVDQPGVGRFASFEHRLAPEPLAELLRDRPHAGYPTANVERTGWRRALAERAQHV